MLFLFQSWEMVLGSLKKYTMMGVYHTHNPSEIDTTYSFWWLVGSLLSLQVIAACGSSWDWDTPPSTKPNRHPFQLQGLIESASVPSFASAQPVSRILGMEGIGCFPGDLGVGQRLENLEQRNQNIWEETPSKIGGDLLVVFLYFFSE